MKTGRPLKLFFSGIGGSGVSAIAGFMKDHGHQVSGSDRAFDTSSPHPLKEALSQRGIAIYPQDGSGITEDLDLLVTSTAVEDDTPEPKRARALGIPMMTRPQYLSELASSYKTIAVSGTNGKSTTAGMLAFAMHKLGMNPNFIGGGRVKAFRGLSLTGNHLSGSSEHLVIEACESDGSIVNYKPRHSIILNLSLDHHQVDETAEMFQTLIKNTSGMVAVNSDDHELVRAGIKGNVTFSTDSASNYRATDILLNPLDSSFRVNGTGFRLRVPGLYNIQNALPCIALLSEMGVQLKDISNALREFDGIERRFDIHMNEGGRVVIDDYAHNPRKISSFMQAASAITEGTCYIFQPHGFGPTRLMKEGYIDAFCKNLRDADHLILMPIFYAGGTVQRDISSRDILDGVAACGKSAELAEDRASMLSKVGRWKCHAVLGARDESLSTLARDIAFKVQDIRKE